MSSDDSHSNSELPHTFDPSGLPLALSGRSADRVAMSALPPITEVGRRMATLLAAANL
jgi:hypothetical protein